MAPGRAAEVVPDNASQLFMSIISPLALPSLKWLPCHSSARDQEDFGEEGANRDTDGRAIESQTPFPPFPILLAL